MNEPTRGERSSERLSQLPELDPPTGAWAGIEARLEAAPRRARARAALALAALAVIAVGVYESRAPRAPSAPAALAESGAQLSADALLDRRAAALEQLLAVLPESRLTRASTGLTTTLLEDRIAMVDERLSLPEGAALSAQAMTELKKQRVVLLDSLVRVKYASAVTASL